MYGLSLLPLNFEIINPLSDTFSDLELTDIVYSKIRTEQQPVDTNIVLVNIGYLGREAIAEEINRINEHEPAVIAIDAMFFTEKAPEVDSTFADAMSRVKNMVLVAKLENPNDTDQSFDSLSVPAPRLLPYVTPAYANLITEGIDEYRTARIFAPTKKVKDSTVKAFAVTIAEKFRPEQTKKFLARNNDVEVINYSRDDRGYRMLDYSDVFSGNIPFSLKGKIVLMGYMGTVLGASDWTDKFFTPLNATFVGKTPPDMYGVIVHANIISMIMEENFVDEAPDWINYLIGFVISVLNIGFFLWVKQNKDDWYDLVTKLIQVVEIILLVAAVIYIYHKYQYKLDMTLGIAATALAGDFVEVYLGGFQRLMQFLRGLVARFGLGSRTVQA